jgi:hypothetical protein
MALSADNITTYIPALNTVWALGSLLERHADFAKARIMYSKALAGYEKVVGPDHPRSQSLHDKLCALDAEIKNRTLVKVEEPINNIRGGLSHLVVEETPSRSKHQKLFQKLGWR